MQIVKKISEIREILSDLDKNNSKINLIPTMGNIHEGHLSLLKEANKYEGINVVSIFINPTQFNDIKDFENYPNTFDQDVNLLSKNNCEIIFAPHINEMYPNGLETKKTIFEYREILCDVFRPGHFDGVTTVVKMLLNIIKPSNVFLGEKDFQQLKIVEKLIKENFPNQKLVRVPTVRSDEGIALSSRNSKLSKKQMTDFILFQKEVIQFIANLDKKSDLIEANKKADEFIKSYEKYDYFEFRNASNLSLEGSLSESRLFYAIYKSGVRLIDNLEL